MNRNIEDYMKKFNAELDRLKKIIPGLDSSNLMVCRSQPTIFIGYVDNGRDTFATEWTKEEPQILAIRLLDGHIALASRLYENIKALERIKSE